MPKKTKPAQSAIKEVVPENNIAKASQKRTSGAKKATRKKTSSAPARGASKRTQVQPAAPTHPSDDQVRTRAYFIAQRRHRLGMPGDASSDWLEAKKQLLSELGPR